MLLSILPVFFSELGLQPLSQSSGAYNPVDGITARLNSMYLSEVSVSEEARKPSKKPQLNFWVYISIIGSHEAATWNTSAKGFEPWDLLSTVSPRSVAK
ncbi:hypothetical protein J6590_102620, partial [Homalodisca vitripennis]